MKEYFFFKILYLKEKTSIKIFLEFFYLAKKLRSKSSSDICFLGFLYLATKLEDEIFLLFLYSDKKR